jgi:hypothetical protein
VGVCGFGLEVNLLGGNMTVYVIEHSTWELVRFVGMLMTIVAYGVWSGWRSECRRG